MELPKAPTPKRPGLPVVLAAAALVVLVAVLCFGGKRQPDKGNPVYEKTGQVIVDTISGFTFTLPAGFTRYGVKEADTTHTGYRTYYALGRDFDLNIECYPAFFADSTAFSNSDISTISAVHSLFFGKGIWHGPILIDVDGTQTLRCIGPHPAIDDGVSICYDFRHGRALITCMLVYYTPSPRRPDWDRVRAANALMGSGLQFH